MRASFLQKLTFVAGPLLLLLLCFARPVAAAPGSVNALSLTPRRVGASVASLVGLGGLVCGGLALARRKAPPGKPRAVALAAGAVSATLGLLVIATARGGFGTGQGLAGGIAALALGLSSVALALRAGPRPGRDAVEQVEPRDQLRRAVHTGERVLARAAAFGRWREAEAKVGAGPPTRRGVLVGMALIGTV